MIKTLMKSIREYKLPSILTIIFIMGEVIIEVIIPFITANLVNDIKYQAPIESVLLQVFGLLLWHLYRFVAVVLRQLLALRHRQALLRI